MTATNAARANPKGSGHPLAVYSESQISRVKAMLRDAPRVEHYAPGTFDRVSRATGVSVRVVKHVRDGTCWALVEPASGNG